MWHVWETGEEHKGFWWADLTERHHLKELRADEKIIIKWIFKTWNGEAWIGLIWISTGRGGGRL
jgi:hypothetical protein